MIDEVRHYHVNNLVQYRRRVLVQQVFRYRVPGLRTGLSSYLWEKSLVQNFDHWQASPARCNLRFVASRVEQMTSGGMR